MAVLRFFRPFRIAAFAAAAAAALSGWAPAGGAAQAQTYDVGVENYAYLPAYAVEEGEYRGFARALFDAFAGDKGYVFVYRPMPVVRLTAALTTGEVDLKYPDNPQWAADAKKDAAVVYSDPVHAYIDGVHVTPDRLGRPAGAVATLGMVRGFTPRAWNDEIKSGAVALHENNNFTALLETTLVGRNDGAYASVAVVEHHLAKTLNRPGALVFDPALPHVRGDYRLSSVKHPALIAEFNAWAAANAGRIAALKAEFGVEKGLR